MSEFWRKKRVLCTGGSGFLGSHIVERLKLAEAVVSVPHRKDFDLVKADACWRAFDSCNPDIVIHAAALVGGIGANAATPGTFFFKNMAMGMNVIETARQFKCRKVVVIGTVCEYPKFASVPFVEEDLWSGYPEETNAPYGIAKKALLAMGQAYRREFGLSVIHLLPVNLFGPGDNFDVNTSHVIPALIRKFAEAAGSGARRVGCWGTGKPTREFLYVDDAAEGIVVAAEKYDKPEPVNIGAGFEIGIRTLANKIAVLTGFEGEIAWDETKPDGQPRRSLDVTRAYEEFGWRARTDFETALSETVRAYVNSTTEARHGQS